MDASTLMPIGYFPSYSSGIYGSFTCYQTLVALRRRQEMERKRALAKEMEDEKRQAFNQEMEKRKAETKLHRTAQADFSIIQIPQTVKSKPKQQQLIPIAGMYKKMLFDHMPRRKHLGGWVFLATKNMKNNGGATMKSPKDLGYSIIEPKYVGDPIYQKSVIRFLRDEIISISGCVGKSGSYYVSVTFDNNSSERHTFTIPKGMVWEQDRFRKVQNLAVTGFYKNQPSDSTAELELKEDLEITIPGNAKGVVVNIECFCIDSNHSSPNGEGMNATPLRSDVAVTAANQKQAWDGLNANEGHDLFDP